VGTELARGSRDGIYAISKRALVYVGEPGQGIVISSQRGLGQDYEHSWPGLGLQERDNASVVSRNIPADVDLANNCVQIHPCSQARPLVAP
jgi:hypothetical protein